MFLLQERVFSAADYTSCQSMAVHAATFRSVLDGSAGSQCKNHARPGALLDVALLAGVAGKSDIVCLARGEGLPRLTGVDKILARQALELVNIPTLLVCEPARRAHMASVRRSNPRQILDHLALK